MRAYAGAGVQYAPQMAAFRSQLALATELARPVSLHCVHAQVPRSSTRVRRDTRGTPPTHSRVSARPSRVGRRGEGGA